MSLIYHLIFVSRHDPLKWMTNHWEGKRSACKVDYVWISWCHHACLCKNTNTNTKNAIILACVQMQIQIHKFKNAIIFACVQIQIQIHKYENAIILACVSRSNLFNSFLWLVLVNDRKCLSHVVDPTWNTFPLGREGCSKCSRNPGIAKIDFADWLTDKDPARVLP